MMKGYHDPAIKIRECTMRAAFPPHGCRAQVQIISTGESGPVTDDPFFPPTLIPTIPFLSSFCTWLRQLKLGNAMSVNVPLPFLLTQLSARSDPCCELMMCSLNSILYMTVEYGDPAIELWWSASKRCSPSKCRDQLESVILYVAVFFFGQLILTS